MKAPLTRTRCAGDAVGRRPQAAAEGIGQLVVAVEGAVGDHQRDVALAPRQRQRRLELVVDDPHPGQAAPDVRRGPVEAVVVVPLERGPFRAPVLAQVVDVGFARPPGGSSRSLPDSRAERPRGMRQK